MEETPKGDANLWDGDALKKIAELERERVEKRVAEVKNERVSTTK